MSNWFKNLETKAQRIITILTIVTILGTSSLAKVVSTINQRLRYQAISSEVHTSALKGWYPRCWEGETVIYRSKMFGLWKKQEGTHVVEIRSTVVFDDTRQESMAIEWAVLKIDGRTEMYHAVYSPQDEAYYFVDWHGDYQWVRKLKQVE